ncbi:hypothetical protein HDU76_012388 [Blyttiomyces sp. JEL0837]|nr:hypothetical protein HDU76_012388 [Blyttiomyces sp. JEL0837]
MGAKVQLYIYDLSAGMARMLSQQLTGKLIEGIWHTAVVAFGKEVYFGQGIAIEPPGTTPHGVLVQVVDMGETEIPEDVYWEYIDSMKEFWVAEKYHLFDNNCNTFSNEVCTFLVNKSIPSHITSLPSEFLSTPFGRQLAPLIENMFGPSRIAAEHREPLELSTASVPTSTTSTTAPKHPHEKLTLPTIKSLPKSPILFSTSKDKVFPALDILRLLVLIPTPRAALMKASPSPIMSILHKFGGSHPSLSTLPNPLRLMSLRLACNLFSTPEGSNHALSLHHNITTKSIETPHRSIITALLVESLLADDKSIRQCAASLGFNMACVQASNSGGLHAKLVNDEVWEEWISEMVAAVLKSLESEENDEIVLRDFSALALLLYCGPESAIALANVLGIDTILAAKSKMSMSSERGRTTAQLALEIGNIVTGN